MYNVVFIDYFVRHCNFSTVFRVSEVLGYGVFFPSFCFFGISEQGLFGNKSWWSDSLHRKRKQIHRLKSKLQEYKRAAMQLKRKLRQEKQESLKEENTRQLFSQFKSMNSNKVSIIPALVESITGKIAKTDLEKAKMLVSWFSQPPQPPSYSGKNNNNEVNVVSG
ncbi:hypothetical protein RFI_38433 [Reticulomyxa filosa]|uniref:Uncharacterized protein n=1 Tax=Reticulomyxa filosa TaxID=46433 RepID=X6LD54_RETFI|nr:hypothetical protein RFI_38433 [Reticulomyxa filosa]|eukprot:ETN99056.1 hypothetical protein RFI_38433 [Reticulomyxa filosa]